MKKYLALIIMISLLICGCTREGSGISVKGTEGAAAGGTEAANGGAGGAVTSDDGQAAAGGAGASDDGQAAAGGAGAPNSGQADAENPLTVTCFDVDKGDAFLLTTKNSAVLIDTGYKRHGEILLSFMEDRGIEKLDALIISHFDKDHVGGAEEIIEKMPIDRILTTNRTNNDKRTVKFFEAVIYSGQKNEEIRDKLSFSLDNADYEIIPPKLEDYPDKDDNNSSLLVKVSYGDTSMLFTGDAESYRIEEILKESDIKSTILKVPYHGHFQKEILPLVEAVSPLYAVITSSEEELEDQATLDVLKKSGVKTYLTRQGRIEFILNGETVEVRQGE